MRSLAALLVAAALVAGCDLDPCANDVCMPDAGADEGGPTIATPIGDEVVRHPVVLASGRFEGDLVPSEQFVSTSTADGVFKALLRVDDRVASVRDDTGVTPIRTRYERPTNDRYVRLVWVRAADHDGSFQAPEGEPHDEASAIRRLQVAGLLMQTFTAESLRIMGLGRRTFRLDMGDDGLPKVTVHTTSLTRAETEAMDGGALWSHLYGELSSMPDRDRAIDVAMLGMTRWDPQQQKALAHTALGGGRLALFGSGTLHTFPEGLANVAAAFRDTRTIDTSDLLDDSAYRGTYWANFATGLGAMLHELGHCLGLPHPANGRGVMAREFDHVNRLFILTEPESNTGPGLPLIGDDDVKLWDEGHATRLRYHRFLAADPLPDVQPPPRIRLSNGDLLIESRAGVRHVEYRRESGDSVAWEVFEDAAPPTSITRTMAEIRSHAPDGSTATITVVDDEGDTAELQFALP